MCDWNTKLCISPLVPLYGWSQNMVFPQHKNACDVGLERRSSSRLSSQGYGVLSNNLLLSISLFSVQLPSQMLHDRAQSILMRAHMHICCDLLHKCDNNLISYFSLSCSVSHFFLPPSVSLSVKLLYSVRFLLVFTVHVPASVIKADDLAWVCSAR